MKDPKYSSPNIKKKNINKIDYDVSSPELLDIYKSPPKEEDIEFDNAEYCYQHKIMTEKTFSNIPEFGSSHDRERD